MPRALKAAAATAGPSSSISGAGAAQRVTSYKGLSGDDFRHPLDRQNTALLRALPGLEMIARNFIGPAAEQVLLLENLATSVAVGPDQLPSIHALLLEAATILHMDPPELYVRQNPVPNAYTLAVAGRKPFIVVRCAWHTKMQVHLQPLVAQRLLPAINVQIVQWKIILHARHKYSTTPILQVHTALLDLLAPAEVQAVLAHELGHLKCDHGVWLTAANVLALGTVSLLPLVSNTVEEGLMRWLRAAELTCDRAALLVAQDERVVISSLMKLAGGSPSIAAELNVDAFLRQVGGLGVHGCVVLVSVGGGGYFCCNTRISLCTKGVAHAPPFPLLVLLPTGTQLR
jgi:Zn-dependent protease with chaperone function